MEYRLNSQEYIRVITQCLGWLKYYVELSDSLCLYDVNNICENVYKDILNAVTGWSLINANTENHNAKAIDLIDRQQKVLIQVSSRTDKRKVADTLAGLEGQGYVGFTFYYLSITDNPKQWAASSFRKIPNGIIYNPANIWGVGTLLQLCSSCGDIDVLKRVYEACRMHFGIDAHGDQMTPKGITMDVARQFILAYASIYGELETIRDMCSGFLGGNLCECNPQSINTHIGTHLNRRILASLNHADMFRRCIAERIELWKIAAAIAAGLQKMDRLFVANNADAKVAQDLASAIRNLIEDAVRIVASSCPNAEAFCYEFNEELNG